MNTEPHMKCILRTTVEAIERIDTAAIDRLIDWIIQTRERNGTIYTFGNGGSASNASHFCCDFLKDVSAGRDRRFRILCLNDNVPTILAIANDYAYDEIFREQLKNFLGQDDLVIAFSCSGNSPNVVNALEFARERGVRTAVFCGFDGGTAIQIADLAIHARVDDMEASENVHYTVCHAIKHVVMEILDQCVAETVNAARVNEE